ncbi:hypothetical protein [Acinetobacter sp. ANC 5502]
MKTNKSNSLLLWILIGVLFAICAGIFVWQSWFVNHPAPPTQQATVHSKTKAPPMARPVSEPAVTPEVQPAHTEQPKSLVNDETLKQPIPQNPALAKEEVSKLEDIQQQLKEQEATLKTQHTDADRIIELKQQQIKLLEQQLAGQQKSSK